jgi:GNAT superfamily N-acetyltransferase
VNCRQHPNNSGESKGVRMYSYRHLREKDEKALNDLLKTGFPIFLENDYWNWKYKRNPYFDPSLVVLAEEDGKVVGCNHWLPRELKLSHQLKVKSALAGDLLVHREHRGKGVAAGLLGALRSSDSVKKNNILLIYMFAPLKLNKRLYAPVAGYVAAPNSTSTYKKFFSCRELKERIDLINNRIRTDKDLIKKLQGLEMSILFRLTGLPVFTLDFNSEGLYLKESEAKNPDVVIEGCLPLSSAIIEGTMGVGCLLDSLITGRLRVKKGLLKTFKLRKAFRVIQNVLR